MSQQHQTEHWPHATEGTKRQVKRHCRVGNARAVHVQQETALLAQGRQSLDLRHSIHRAQLRGLRDAEHPRLRVVHSRAQVLEVGLHQRRRQLGVRSWHGEHLATDQCFRSAALEDKDERVEGEER